MVNTNLISIDELLKRYSMFSAVEGNNFTKRALYNWRINRNFPEPRISKPRLFFTRSEVIAWEKGQDMGFLHDE